MTLHPLASLLKREIDLKRNFSPLSSQQIIYSSPLSFHFRKMGILILAGGRGSRLGFEGAKGLVSLRENSTLFSLLFEKIRKKETTHPLFVAIMTSPFNEKEILQYLEKNRWFGKDPSSVDLFIQNTLPVADEEGKLIIDEQGKAIEAPNGNGEALFGLHDSGILKKWARGGVELIQVLPVENLVANPFDEELLGAYEAFGDEIVVRGITREDPEEKIGVLCLEGSHLRACEYTETTKEMRNSLLSFPFGYSGLFSCTLDFAQKLAIRKLELPYHVAKKKKGEKNIYQFETFIFDLFPYAECFKIFSSERKQTFFPIKTPEDLAYARKLLQFICKS
ncbi:MAG: UTP--glucose-1-phosphate uridylyltransferase [Simkania negevensis]|nr:UTP--glucose-1-phosphate uridylyltransferase [Simkania negevensis]